MQNHKSDPDAYEKANEFLQLLSHGRFGQPVGAS
jgi:hypothetical protein